MMNPMRILVRLVLNWKFLEIISRCCATLSAIGCAYTCNTLSGPYTCNTLSDTCTCNTLSNTYTCYIYMQHTVWYIYMQHTAPRFDRRLAHTSTVRSLEESTTRCFVVLHTATHGNILQHPATEHGEALYGTPAMPPQATATHCNTLQHDLTGGRSTSQRRDFWKRARRDAMWDMSPCNILQSTATHCNTLQHNSPLRRDLWKKARRDAVDSWITLWRFPVRYWGCQNFMVRRMLESHRI